MLLIKFIICSVEPMKFIFQKGPNILRQNKCIIFENFGKKPIKILNFRVTKGCARYKAVYYLAYYQTLPPNFSVQPRSLRKQEGPNSLRRGVFIHRFVMNASF